MRRRLRTRSRLGGRRNMLWSGGVVSGVVDWAAACRGPLGIDAARIRLDLSLAGRHAEAEALEERLRPSRHPHWDVVDAVDVLPFHPDGAHRVHAWPPGGDAGRRAAIEAFVGGALAELGV